MKNVVLMILLCGFIGACSSNPVIIEKEAVKEQIGTDKYVDEEAPDVPNWVEFTGMKDGYFYATGVAEGKIDSSPVYLERAAMMDAESLLFSKAPHEYREIVQNAVDGMSAEQVNFQRIQTKLLKLTGVSGIEFPADKRFCQKAIRDNGEYVKPTRVCYRQARVSVLLMNKTIERVVQELYGSPSSDEFHKRLGTELDKIDLKSMNNKPTEASPEKVVNAHDEG